MKDVFAEVTGRAPGARIVWMLGASTMPADVEGRLRALGCREQDPPLTSYITALATTTEPPPVRSVEVRKVESFADFLTGLEVSIAGWRLDDDRAARMRLQAESTYAGRRSRPGGDWLAFSAGVPVATARAIAGPHGLFLTGGVTLPEARGRGAYRALVAARWHEAVQRGTPALVVHAEESSRPILESIGFERVCPVVELVSES